MAPDNVSAARFLLWIDAVGGFLVCLKDEVVLGQAAPDNQVDIPILGDISRRQARIRREGEAYLFQPLQPLAANGQPGGQTRLLTDGDELELGGGVRMRFRQPHSLSASARLELVSRHRTSPSVDAIVLMAESCVLGPQWHNHVVCRHWPGDLVLFRHHGELYCRAMGTLEIDGRRSDGRGRIGCNSRIVGNDFSLSLEELDKCATEPLR